MKHVGCLSKNIDKEMNVPGLTKNQVSSHLQVTFLKKRLSGKLCVFDIGKDIFHENVCLERFLI